MAEGDLDQAVGYLLMGESSQQAFDFSTHESIFDINCATNATSVASHEAEQATITDASSPRGSLLFPPQQSQLLSGSVSDDAIPTSPEEQLILMGYSRNQAIQALQVAHGDLEQATNFLLMGNSRQGFLLDVEHFGSERNLQSSSTSTSSICPVESEAVATVDMTMSTATVVATPPPINNPLPYSGPKPKIVSTRSFVNVSDAGPFCTCFAASRFLDGGEVAAPFFDIIMESGIELYRKLNRRLTVDKVLKLYSKSHLGIEAVRNGELDPRKGMHMGSDLQHDNSIRKLFASCRNEQEDGWQVVILELPNDCFCTCLPPKGSGSKFWFFDFTHRSNIRTSGAYALVHNSLLQMEETVESMVGSIGRREEMELVPFTLYRVQNRT